MGQHGPAPYPTALRLMNGETRASRINANEPKPAEGRPTCPAGVSPEVKAVWTYTIKQLDGMGTAAQADRDTLICYCEAVVMHRRACAALVDAPLSVTHPITGAVRANPALRIQHDSAATIKAYAREFGLTPAARVGVEVRPKSEGNNADRLIG